MNTGHDTKATLSISMQTEDFIGFTQTLTNCQVDFSSLYDPIGFNIFHDLANCIIKEESLLKFLNILIISFKLRYKGNGLKIVKEMLNLQTFASKQTPLLLAINHNRIVNFSQELIKELVLLGADPSIKDVNRQGPMHICAQFGKVRLFVYFHSLWINFEEKDIESRTPLHISALEGY